MKASILQAAALLAAFISSAAVFAQDGNKGVSIPVNGGNLTIIPLNDNSARVVYTQGRTYPLDELIYIEHVVVPRYKVTTKGDVTTIKQKRLVVEYDRAADRLTFIDQKTGKVLEEQAHSRKVGLSQTSIQGYDLLDVQQSFVSPQEEYIFGTGQFQDGYLNIRALTRRLTQVNTQIAIPFIMSSKGYGLLWNNYGLTDFNPSTHSQQLNATDEAGNVIEVDATSTNGNQRERRVSDTFKADIVIPQSGTYSFLLDVGQSMARKLYLAIDGKAVIDLNNTWLPPTGSVRIEMVQGRHEVEVRGVRGDHPTVSWRLDDGTTVLHSPVAAALDYTVFVGSADEIVASYRQLTGPAPDMLDDMLGYVHCRERYNTQAELLDNAREFKKRGIPLNVIVQDWQYWGKYGWNAMQFDEDRYPDPAAMTRELHSMNVKFMLSVWSKVDVNSTLGKELRNRGYYIDGTDWVDFFNPDAAAFHWHNFRDKLLKPYDIDVWWFDATEPENDDLRGRFVANRQIPGEIYRNVYPLKVIHTMYNGLTADDHPRTPAILTRSAFSGMQRYGVVVWSGDVGNDMDCLRRQIAGGLNYSACGMPWWTYDAGGFFRPGNQYTDADYQERMIRWIQTAVFMPIMRVHGYMSRTEPWNYLPDTETRFINCINERTAMHDYVADIARRVSHEGYTPMRPLIFDFPTDTEALRQDTEYMFGPTYLVCPITEEHVTQWRVYLPANPKGWRDHYTGITYQGGQYITVPVTLDHIPVFERK